jgi:hypothetical protein
MITTGANLPAIAHEPGHIVKAMREMARKTGRPCEYSPAIAAEFCARIAKGESLRSICKDDHMPSHITIYDWQDNIEDFAVQYALARTKQATGFVHEGLEILDNADDSAMSCVRKAEARANYRLSLAKCYDRETYGDKVQQDIRAAGVMINTTLPELAKLINGG